MPTRAALGAAMALASLALACRSRASSAECRAMAERYVDLAASESPGGRSLSAAQADAVRDVERGLKRAVPAFRRVQDRCEDVAAAEASCALVATTTRSWEACVKGER